MEHLTPSALKAELELNGRSQGALAARLGVDVSAVNRIANGKRRILASEVPVIEAYLESTATSPAVNIRSAREARGWSQAELATRAGTNQATIQRLETGETQHSKHLMAVLSALDQQADPPPKFTLATTSNGNAVINLRDVEVPMSVALQIAALVNG